MKIQEQIKTYLQCQEEPKRSDMQTLHQQILQQLPNCKLWFLDGKNEVGKVISNPSIGYGQFAIQYKDGSTKEFYQIGLSGNTAGISVYIMGLDDKKYLVTNYGTTIGKAAVTGYCIKFKNLKDINFHVLLAAIQDGVKQTNK